MTPSATTPARVPERGVLVAATSERLRLGVVAVALLLLPIVFDGPAYEAFRLPKELLLIACGVLLAALATIEALLQARPIAPREWPRALKTIVFGALGWSAVSAIASQNIALSISSLLFAFSAAMLFVTTYNAARRWPEEALLICCAPAVINASIALLQRSGHWPFFAFQAELDARSHAIGLLGNPNDVGAYLLLPFVAMLALGVTPSRYRPAGQVAAAVILAGVAVSETMTALAGCVVAVIAMALLMRRGVALLMIAVLLILGMAAATLLSTRRTMLDASVAAARAGDFDPILSNRTEAFIAAWRMFVAHPVIGVGPGGFRYAYFDAKIALEDDHPEFLNKHAENFGEAHNEHLQLLAEGGLPLYGFFLAGLWVVGRRSFRIASETPRTLVAMHIALPAALAIAVSTLASFPMRLAAPTVTMLAILAMTLAWSEHESR